MSDAPKSSDCTLTASRQSCLMTCPRKHLWSYELCIRPANPAGSLRFGTIWHEALELAAKQADPAVAYAAIDEAVNVAWYADETDRAFERETLRNLLAGYLWRWGDMPMTVLACEEEFSMPLYGPAGEPSEWKVAGKRDKRVMVEARELVMEHKTSSEDLAPDAAYWSRLRMDPQISVYILSCRMVGSAVDTVLYDVARKPTIRPRQKETPEEWGKRLLADIETRPDYYFVRHEIPRLEADLDEAKADLWDCVKLIEHFRAEGRWPRNTSACNRFGRCAYWNLCTNGYKPGEPLPEQFVIAEKTHMELTITDEH